MRHSYSIGCFKWNYHSRPVALAEDADIVDSQAGCSAGSVTCHAYWRGSWDTGRECWADLGGIVKERARNERKGTIEGEPQEQLNIHFSTSACSSWSKIFTPYPSKGGVLRMCAKK